MGLFRPVVGKLYLYLYPEDGTDTLVSYIKITTPGKIPTAFRRVFFSCRKYGTL